MAAHVETRNCGLRPSGFRMVFSRNFAFVFSTSNNPIHFAVHARLGLLVEGLRESKFQVFVGVSLGCSRRSFRVFVGIMLALLRPSGWLVFIRLVVGICVAVALARMRGMSLGFS